MTFEKRNIYEDLVIPREGCGKCTGCSEKVGAEQSNGKFGGQHSDRRQNKGC